VKQAKEDDVNQTADLHAPEQKLDNPPKHDVALTTSVNGNLISIDGSGNFSVPNGQAATHCKFTLTDTSGANVQFSSLDAADNINGCPPSGSGNCSSQVVGVTMNGNTGQFTDSNNNVAPMTIGYQWHFTCDGPYTVSPFDPVITNGGKSV
jgi:hypothetical protein